MRLTVVYAILWIITGYIFGLAIQRFFDLASNIGFFCGAANLVLGLLLLLLVQRSPRLSRLFYEGPRANERGSLFISLMWSLPVVLLLWALVFLILGWLTGKP